MSCKFYFHGLTMKSTDERRIRVLEFEIDVIAAHSVPRLVSSENVRLCLSNVFLGTAKTVTNRSARRFRDTVYQRQSASPLANPTGYFLHPVLHPLGHSSGLV